MTKDGAVLPDSKRSSVQATPGPRAVWVGARRDQHLAVRVLRRYSTRLVCRVTEPGEFYGVVCDFHPADVIGLRSA